MLKCPKNIQVNAMTEGKTYLFIYTKEANETKASLYIYRTLKEKEGLQELADYFYNLDITGFNFRFPPHTSDKEARTEISTTAEDLDN